MMHDLVLVRTGDQWTATLDGRDLWLEEEPRVEVEMSTVPGFSVVRLPLLVTSLRIVDTEEAEVAE